MCSIDTRHDQADTTSETNGPDAHVCNAGSETPFALDDAGDERLAEDCPDCRAAGGVECDWPCSSNWN